MDLAAFLQAFGIHPATMVEVLPGGFNSVVNLVIHNDRNYVIKVIGRKKKLLSQSEAETLASDLARYHYLLAGCGIRLPEFMDVKLIATDYSSGAYLIAQLSPFVGKNLEQTLKTANDADLRRTIKTMLEEVIVPVFSHLTPEGDLDVGIDPKPANFTFHDGDVYYVDIMPPRFRKNGIPMVEYPAPITMEGKGLGYHKHFTTVGVLQIFYLQLCRLRPERCHIFLEELRKFACSLSERVEIGLVDLVAGDFSNKSHQAKIEKIISSSSPYELRAIAIQLAGSNHELLERIFQLTHFEDSLSQETVGQIKRELTALL